MTRLLDHLNQDHRHLSRLLNLLDKLLDLFHEGTEPDYELMCEMLEYMENYADQVHHPTEDLIFERMRAYGNEHRPILDVLMNQHQVLSEMSKNFHQSLEGIVHEEVLRRDQVEAEGRELVQTLRRHLEMEESEAFPLARQLLSERDWEEIDKAASKVTDPVFGDRDPGRFRTLYQHLLSQTES
ncbi:MAG: hemerythrin domain-containing protein [Pseudomonadota bacterium]|nr:hemerythrin domain-containing protein [Pseudomonadota bacterium]